MGAVSYRPGADNAGFEKLSGNKYMAPIRAIMPTQQTGGDQIGTLGLPDGIIDLLEEEGYLMDRAHVSPMHDEDFGQYNGFPTRIEPVDGLEYGVMVPDYAATATEQINVHSGDGIHLIEEQEQEPRRVCITFADDDVPLSLDALEYQKVGDGDGVAGYWDRRNDTYIIQ